MELAPAEVLRAAGHPLQMVQVTDGMVRHFTTAMTGELHHLLMTQSLIGKGLPPSRRTRRRLNRGWKKGWRSRR
ncbi:2-dehydro-3-deoxygalactonokinase [Klebsiella michiganensis]|nr:2-dehydro-3-deoxygalactonokinase [Klebsiella michiganensis]